MTPYYTEPGIETYHGDCRDILPGLGAVDLVLTDPPYGIGCVNMEKDSGAQRGTAKAPKGNYSGLQWDDNPVEQWLIDTISTTGKHCCIWGGNYYKMEPSSAWLVWDKMNGKNNFADCELAWTDYGCAVRMKRHLWNGMLRKGREDRSHPTQKPLEIMAWCIELCPDSPQTILDPFMGSGTTLRAAKDLGRKAIGIEIEEKYCEIAVKRLRQEVLGI